VTPWDDFGNDVGNKAVVLPHTLEISIELAERVSKLCHVMVWQEMALYNSPWNHFNPYAN
jgi:hypothetical protein